MQSTPSLTKHQLEVVQSTASLSLEGKIHFGEVVQRLIAAGIERYHADYARGETTYYAHDGASAIISLGAAAAPIADSFSSDAVAAAVRQAQRGEIMYHQFTRQALAAGCVGYFVQLTGMCVQYFGRRGEIHTEWFPGAGH